MDCDSVTDGLTKCFHLRHWGDIDTDLGDSLVDMNVDDDLGDTNMSGPDVDKTLVDMNVDDNLGDTDFVKYFGW